VNTLPLVAIIIFFMSSRLTPKPASQLRQIGLDKSGNSGRCFGKPYLGNYASRPAYKYCIDNRAQGRQENRVPKRYPETSAPQYHSGKAYSDNEADTSAVIFSLVLKLVFLRQAYWRHLPFRASCAAQWNQTSYPTEYYWPKTAAPYRP
jgi:hypothetical protein